MSAELGLYIHLPFCPSRCPYCDFFALPWSSGSARPLLAAMHVHLERLAPLAQGRRLASLYLGGGTPSMWPARDLAGLIQAARQRIGLAQAAEISLEANPGTVSQGKLEALRQAGVNRLSLGAQSLDDGLLARLGRRHDAAQTRRALAAARRAGFENISLDLIYGLPGQSQDMACADLARALALEPDHLSYYELTLGADTPFGRLYAKGRPPLPGEDELADWEERAWELVRKAGLERYEVSNFARPGRRCRHNQATWRGGDYLALGPGAHGHLAGVRWAFVADARGYAEQVRQGGEPLAFREEVDPRGRGLELFMLGLRTTEGVDMQAVDRLLGGGLEKEWGAALAQAVSLGWARRRAGRLIPTPRGLTMADAAAALFA
ncbi:hypothetical protein AAU61_05655 [Desulfocarbo indianensis]|nr:hypothetical protein AAU61_05655 [Desulfocarbo indianensis]